VFAKPAHQKAQRLAALRFGWPFERQFDVVHAVARGILCVSRARRPAAPMPSMRPTMSACFGTSLRFCGSANSANLIELEPALSVSTASLMQRPSPPRYAARAP
jgi:hypothetical protein